MEVDARLRRMRSGSAPGAVGASSIDLDVEAVGPMEELEDITVDLRRGSVLGERGGGETAAERGLFGGRGDALPVALSPGLPSLITLGEVGEGLDD